MRSPLPLETTNEALSAPLIDLGDSTPVTASPVMESAAQNIGDVDGVDMDAPHAPYRSPEPVIEPEEPPPGYVISEHPITEDENMSPHVSPLREVDNSSFNISDWQKHPSDYDPMDIDDDFATPDKPSIGPGMLPHRVLELAHEHTLRKPLIHMLPKPNPPKTPVGSGSISEAAEPALPTGDTSSASLPSSQAVPEESTYNYVASESDVLGAIPGGENDWDNWFFCSECWGWLRITAGREEQVPDMGQWNDLVPEATPEERGARIADWARYNDLLQYRLYNDNKIDHFHKFENLVVSTHGQRRIERIPVNDEVNAFPHVALSFEQPDSWSKHQVPQKSATIYISAGSNKWFLVEPMIPGQLPKGLVSDFTKEKSGNPGVGQTGAQSIAGAWNLISTWVSFAFHTDG